jgi:hypothetical protein
MQKLFKFWFIPIIFLSTVAWMIGASYSTKTEPTSFVPKSKHESTFEQKIINKAIDKSVEIRHAPRNLLTANAFVGAVIGWAISKILDIGLILIRNRIKK